MRESYLLTWWLVAASLGACGKDDSEAESDAKPTAAAATDALIASVSPTDGKTGVPTGTSFYVRFNEEMDETTLVKGSVKLTVGDTSPEFEVDYAATDKTLSIDAALRPSQTYKVELSTAIKSKAGKALAKAYVWSFTTSDAAPSGGDKKPVIYLYPETETAVRVEVDFAGIMKIAHPQVADLQHPSWDVVASPDGTLRDAAGAEHGYLFWEGHSQRLAAIPMDSGFVVSASDSQGFLIETMKRLGLNQRESDDFVTYWLGSLLESPFNLIKFAPEEHAQIAKLSVTPTPDTVLRVFMLFQPLERPIAVTPQELPAAPERRGFTVVEWGGARR